MREVDDYTFKIRVKNRGAVCIDGLELQVHVDTRKPGDAKDDWTPTNEEFAACVIDSLWVEDEGGAEANKLSEAELCAIGSRVFLRMQELGNLPESSQTSSGSMASFPAGDRGGSPKQNAKLASAST